MSSYPPDILKKLQETELEILDAVAAVCAQEGITWFLNGGSLLGAVRHGGFIPWDDDIDIAMLRPDYNRFLEVAPRTLPDAFELINPETTPHYAPMFAKVQKRGTRFHTQETIDAGFDQGIFIDIFPFDYVWADPAKQKRQYAAARRYTRASYLLHSPSVSVPFSGLAKIFMPMVFHAAHFILKHTTAEETLRTKFNAATQACPESESCGLTAFGHPYSSALPTSTFTPPAQGTFEGRQVPIMADYERYLDDHYTGNWHELPPEGQRKTHVPRILDFGNESNSFLQAYS